MSQYSDDEQRALLREWWQRNGKPLVVGGSLAVAIVFGWQGWQKHQANQGQQLSLVFQQLLEQSFEPSDDALPQVMQQLKQLESIKPQHAYTQYGRLAAARLAVEHQQLQEAAAQLNAVLEKPASATLKELATQRLARVLAAQDDAEQALSLLQGAALSEFQAARDELRGDLLVMLGREAEAREAYQQAQANSADNAAIGGLIMKLDDLSQKDA